MIDVGHLAPFDQYDQTLITDLINGDLYPHGLKFRWHTGFPNTDACVLVTPGRYWAGHEAEITAAVSRFAWLLLIVTSDEEGDFDCSSVLHDNVRFWIQTPRQGEDYPEARFFGVGYTPHLRSLPKDPPDKSLDLFLSCQRTHSRRIQAFEALKETPHQSCVIPTEGFMQGLPPAEYQTGMLKAKVAPCPSGAVSVDTFRFWEAIAAHSIPIADAVSPVDGVTDYWDRVCPGAPFPVLREYESLPGYIDQALEDWPANANRVASWWIQTKRRYSHWLREDLTALGAL